VQVEAALVVLRKLVAHVLEDWGSTVLVAADPVTTPAHLAHFNVPLCKMVARVPQAVVSPVLIQDKRVRHLMNHALRPVPKDSSSASAMGLAIAQPHHIATVRSLTVLVE